MTSRLHGETLVLHQAQIFSVHSCLTNNSFKFSGLKVIWVKKSHASEARWKICVMHYMCYIFFVLLTILMTQIVNGSKGLDGLRPYSTHWKYWLEVATRLSHQLPFNLKSNLLCLHLTTDDAKNYHFCLTPLPPTWSFKDSKILKNHLWVIKVYIW